MKEDIQLSEKDTKSRIFFAAAELFATHGYDRVSIRQICETVGVGKPTLYYYFRDKEALLNELIAYSASLGEDLAEKYILSSNEFFDQLFGFIKVHQMFSKNYPHFVRFSLMLNMTSIPENIREQILGMANRKYERFTGFLKKGQDSGYIAPELNIKILVWSLLGTITHMVVMNIYRPDLKVMSDKNINELFNFWKSHFFIQPN
ncbi:MAG: TetR/AcrR family transcriptional regulator [Calditrichia bacterium]